MTINESKSEFGDHLMNIGTPEVNAQLEAGTSDVFWSFLIQNFEHAVHQKFYERFSHSFYSV